MSLEAGSLRDRVNIQKRINVRDPVTGETRVVWKNEWEKVPARIEDISQRDQIAAQAMQSSVSARIIIRYLPGLTSQHRIVDLDGNVYTIEGPPIRDKDSRRESMTLSVSLGPSDGQ
jgi:SPP1 family predicted phage head-tail adaptor